MKIIISARKLELTDAIRAYAEKKFNKLSKFFHDDAEINIILVNERKDRQRTEATVHHRGTLYRVDVITDDMYASIDKSVAGLERQVRKHKTKLERRLRDGAFANVAKSEDVGGELDFEPEQYKIVRTKRIGKKPMSPEEAVLQMNLLGHDFFIFINDSTNDTSLVYRRKDGNYGLIEMSGEQI